MIAGDPRTVVPVDSPPDDLDRVIAALGGEERAAQREMVDRVATAARDGQILLVQAGTGTGKSVGYLVPTVQAVRDAGRTVVIATATLTLQRQLVTRDLPAVVTALPDAEEITTAVLKGRGNYLCRARLAGSADGPDTLEIEVAGGRLEKQAAAVRAWAERTDTGDRDDYPDDVDERVWRSMSATGRECVGVSRCSFGAECFAEQARSSAMGADIIVTNHALLALDAMDDAPVLPEHDLLVVDEAHEFAARATSAATGELSVRAAERAVAVARPLLDEEIAQRLEEAVTGLGASLAELDSQQRPIPRSCVPALAAFRDACHLAITELGKGESGDAARRHRALAGLEELHDVAGRLIGGGTAAVTWFSPYPAPALHVAPLSVAAPLGDYLARPATAVLTSATLNLGGDFAAVAADLGLRSWDGIDVGSPFDYANQGILYTAADLPRPGRDGPDPRTVARIRELVAASGGRAMVLLSSWRAVDTIAANLYERPVAADIAVHVQRRGEPVTRLVERFAADETSVLVGTMSLFQGVDVSGPACQLVIIDRIPFPRPDDPVMAARAEQVESAGGNGFMAVSVPRAGLLLAQGAGRLIRSPRDRGVVAVLDPRLHSARYSDYLRRSLPALWPTTDLAVVTGALSRLAQSSVTADA